MKPVPPQIVAAGPPDTAWFGGSVDRSTAMLRVMAKVQGESVVKRDVSALLNCKSDQEHLRHWSLSAPDNQKADVDSQVVWILGRTTPDIELWEKIAADYRADLFCGLFLERRNRGVTLSPKTMVDLGARGIELGFDIYAP